MNKARMLFFNERKICLFLCMGMLYSFYLWPLVNTVFCILLAGYWLLVCKKNFDIKKPNSRLVLIFSGLYLPCLIGMLYTSNLGEGYFRLSEHLPFILFPIVFGCSGFLYKTMLRLLLTHFIIATFLVSFFGMASGLLSGGSWLPAIWRNENPYILGETYPYIIGIGCLLSLMVIGEKYYDHHMLRKGSVIFLFSFLSFYLLFLNVRLVSFCWLAGMIYLIFQRIHSPVYRMMIIGSIVILLVIAIFRIPVIKTKWDEVRNYKELAIRLDSNASLGKSWGGMSIRIALWKCGKDLIVKHPIWGVGTGDVQDSLQQAYENRKFYFASHYNKYNLHNQYLQTLAGYGIFGLALLLTCIAVPVFFLKNGPVCRIRLIFLTIFVLICFTEVILDTSKGIFWYSFFNSIFVFGAGDDQV